MERRLNKDGEFTAEDMKDLTVPQLRFLKDTCTAALALLEIDNPLAHRSREEIIDYVADLATYNEEREIRDCIRLSTDELNIRNHYED